MKEGKADPFTDCRATGRTTSGDTVEFKVRRHRELLFNSNRYNVSKKKKNGK